MIDGAKHASFVSRTEAPVFELLIKGVNTINTVYSANAEMCLFKMMSPPPRVCVRACMCDTKRSCDQLWEGGKKSQAACVFSR